MDGLVIKKKWIDLNLSGKKTLEIRGSDTYKVGQIIYLLESGSHRVRGTCKIAESSPICASPHWNQEKNRHCVDVSWENVIKRYKVPYAWELSEVKEREKEETMKNLKEKLIKVAMLASIMIMQVSTEVYAGGLKDTKLYTGTIKLLGDITPILVGIEAVLAGVLVAFEGIKYQQADDQEKPKHMKNIKTIIMIGIFIMCASGLLPAILGYYQ